MRVALKGPLHWIELRGAARARPIRLVASVDCDGFRLFSALSRHRDMDFVMEKI